MAPANYRFEVPACNNDGVWNASGAAVVFAVLPHFWQTWWFAPGCWLGGMGMGAALTPARSGPARMVWRICANASNNWARCELATAPGRGTRVAFRVPVKAISAGEATKASYW